MLMQMQRNRSTRSRCFRHSLRTNLKREPSRECTRRIPRGRGITTTTRTTSFSSDLLLHRYTRSPRHSRAPQRPHRHNKPHGPSSSTWTGRCCVPIRTIMSRQESPSPQAIRYIVRPKASSKRANHRTGACVRGQETRTPTATILRSCFPSSKRHSRRMWPSLWPKAVRKRVGPMERPGKRRASRRAALSATRFDSASSRPLLSSAGAEAERAPATARRLERRPRLSRPLLLSRRFRLARRSPRRLQFNAGGLCVRRVH